MEIKRAASQSSNKGPADWFTGTVRIDSLFEAHEPARVRGASLLRRCALRSFFDETSNSLRLRHVHSVAALNLDNS
jgi:hypothetical protein